jgi:chromosome segregation ATPase
MVLVKRATQLDGELGSRRSELARLESELAERERALAAYQDDLDAFQRRFGHALANHYAELDELEAQIAERAAQLRPDDASKRRKAERLRAKVTARQAPAPQTFAEVAGKPATSEEARKLYRDFTKLAHPDLVADPEAKARREAAMVKANAAYATGDVGALSHMLGAWSLAAAGPEPDDPASVLARLERQIGETAGRLDGPTKAREELEASDIGRLMRRASLAERQGRDLLDRLLEEADEMKREARKRLKTLERRLGKAAKKGRGGADDPDGEM